jgi:hypothetical protein
MTVTIYIPGIGSLLLAPTWIIMADIFVSYTRADQG